MPTFSDDDVVDFCVSEAVVRAGVEAEREAQKDAETSTKRKEIVEGHREWAEKNNLLEQ